MIDYSPFWNTLEQSEENWYTLTNKHNLSHSTLHRLKHNKDVSTKTLNDLCRILHCDVCDIVRYIPSDTDQPLQGGGYVYVKTPITTFLPLYSLKKRKKNKAHQVSLPDMPYHIKSSSAYQHKSPHMPVPLLGQFPSIAQYVYIFPLSQLLPFSSFQQLPVQPFYVQAYY